MPTDRLSLPRPLREMLIVAHRGASHNAPENTVAAVLLAWEQKADAAEVDIRLSRDGAIVVMHDTTTGRTTGVQKPVEEQTLAELRSLDAGLWRGPRWKGEKIPLLEEILAALPDGKRLFVECKCGPEIVPELKRIMDGCGKRPEQIKIISFKLETCVAVRRAFPDHEIFLLSGFEQDEETQAWTPSAEELVERARRNGLNGLNLNAKGLLDKAFVRTVHDAGLKITAWTLNDAATARRMFELGVDAITTDRPAFLRERLGALAG